MSSKIIKAAVAALPAGSDSERRKVIDRQVYTAQEQAREILDEARAQAEGMRREAERRTRQVVDQASRRGHRDGLAIWQQRVLDLLHTYNRMVRDLRPQVIDLALEASRKILHHQLEAAPESILGPLDEGLRILRNAAPSRLDVTVHPEDVPAVEQLRKRLQEKDPRWAVMVVRGEPGMERGGCKLASDFGEVDASVETQLDAMRLLLNREAER
ncbi:MAG: FliH/SctL family protein [Thermoanaerobaculia bacterium]